ncbi:guanine nucleotide exchange factor [Anaeramoeba ignava]|uniref:Guanine nucleotide exchange factor n=1 Tax=Anaeramoeba ignava TaxID=1746090 RepID=A0A9Q0R5S6_ANAIG|nr:guanine nucleotide exchange factor [Anaeramoeba ignava]
MSNKNNKNQKNKKQTSLRKIIIFPVNYQLLSQQVPKPYIIIWGNIFTSCVGVNEENIIQHKNSLENLMLLNQIQKFPTEKIKIKFRWKIKKVSRTQIQINISIINLICAIDIMMNEFKMKNSLLESLPKILSKIKSKELSAIVRFFETKKNSCRLEIFNSFIDLIQIISANFLEKSDLESFKNLCSSVIPSLSKAKKSQTFANTFSKSYSDDNFFKEFEPSEQNPFYPVFFLQWQIPFKKFSINESKTTAGMVMERYREQQDISDLQIFVGKDNKKLLRIFQMESLFNKYSEGGKRNVIVIFRSQEIEPNKLISEVTTGYPPLVIKKKLLQIPIYFPSNITDQVEQSLKIVSTDILISKILKKIISSTKLSLDEYGLFICAEMNQNQNHNQNHNQNQNNFVKEFSSTFVFSKLNSEDIGSENSGVFAEQKNIRLKLSVNEFLINSYKFGIWLDPNSKDKISVKLNELMTNNNLVLQFKPKPIKISCFIKISLTSTRMEAIIEKIVLIEKSITTETFLNELKKQIMIPKTKDQKIIALLKKEIVKKKNKKKIMKEKLVKLEENLKMGEQGVENDSFLKIICFEMATEGEDDSDEDDLLGMLRNDSVNFWDEYKCQTTNIRVHKENAIQNEKKSFITFLNSRDLSKKVSKKEKGLKEFFLIQATSLNKAVELLTAEKQLYFFRKMVIRLIHFFIDSGDFVKKLVEVYRGGESRSDIDAKEMERIKSRSLKLLVVFLHARYKFGLIIKPTTRRVINNFCWNDLLLSTDSGVVKNGCEIENLIDRISSNENLVPSLTRTISQIIKGVEDRKKTTSDVTSAFFSETETEKKPTQKSESSHLPHSSTPHITTANETTDTKTSELSDSQKKEIDKKNLDPIPQDDDFVPDFSDEFEEIDLENIDNIPQLNSPTKNNGAQIVIDDDFVGDFNETNGFGMDLLSEHGADKTLSFLLGTAEANLQMDSPDEMMSLETQNDMPPDLDLGKLLEFGEDSKFIQVFMNKQINDDFIDQLIEKNQIDSVNSDDIINFLLQDIDEDSDEQSKHTKKDEDEKTSPSENTDEVGLKPQVNITIDKSDIPPIANIRISQFAKHLTLVSSSMFNGVTIKEWLSRNKKFQKIHSDKLISKIIRNFNQITDWVTLSILSERDMTRRIETITRFIQLANYLQSLGNFNDLMAVMAGLQSNHVFRLRKTWGNVPRKSLEMFKFLDNLTTINQFRGLRNAFLESKSAIVPYIGVFLFDFAYLNELQDQVFGLINWAKLRRLFIILYQIQQTQKFAYNFVPNGKMENILRAVFALNISPDYLSQLSLKIEPVF